MEGLRVGQRELQLVKKKRKLLGLERRTGHSVV